MLRNLKIENLRGLGLLELSDFSTVNIFVGMNGAGKSTVLEALGIVGNANNPNFLANLGTWREMPVLNKNTPDSLKTLFHDCDTSNEVRIGYSFDEVEYSISINSYRESVVSEQMTTFTEENMDEAMPLAVENRLSNFGGVTIKVSGGGNEFCGDFMLRDTGFQVKNTFKVTKSWKIAPPTISDPSFPEKRQMRLEDIKDGEVVNIPLIPSEPQKQMENIGCFYIHTRRSTSASETCRLLTNLFELKQTSQFVDVLKQIDNRVVQLIPGLRNKQPIVLVDIGLSSMLPMNVFGDGFCRICLMLTGVLYHTTKIVVIDDVDSGLHSTVMESFWRSVIKLNESSNFQLFCTTHSEEMLRKTISAFQEAPEKLRVFRIDKRSDGSIHAEKFDYRNLVNAEKVGMDVR